LAVKRVTLPAPAARARAGAAAAGVRQQQRKRQRRRSSNKDDDDEEEEEEEEENENDENADAPRQQPRFDRDAAIADTESRSYYGVVNVEPDDVAQVHGWGLSPALLAYLRAVVRES